MIRYPCPTCGKLLILGESDVDELVLCNSCGARMRVPRTALVSAIPEPVPAPPPPAPRPPAHRPPPPPPPPRGPGPAWWGFLVIAVLIAAAIPTVVLRYRNTNS